jgi:hypothetical protein
MDDRGRRDNPQAPRFLFRFVLSLLGGQFAMSTSNIPPIMCSHT